MKIDPGTLVYVLIAVGSLIVNAYAKNKKKLNEQNRKEATSEQVEEIDEAPSRPVWTKEFEDIFSIPEKPEIVVAPSVPSQNETRTFYEEVQEENNPYIFDYEFIPPKAISQEKFENTLEMKPQLSSIQFEEEVTERVEEPWISFSDHEELQRAIIYSEVLQRKYI